MIGRGHHRARGGGRSPPAMRRFKSQIGDRGGPTVLDRARVASRLPAQDLDRARRFYAEKLGLEPVDERPGGLLYRCASGEFSLFASAGASPGTFTQMAFEVDDLDAVVAELRSRGVVFEEYDFPGLRTVDGFRDSEGNMLGIGQPVR